MSVKQQENPIFVSVFGFLDWGEAFILDRKSRGLSNGTIRFYKMKLDKFLEYCHSKKIQDPIDILPSDIRNFFIYLNSLGHNHGGVFAHYKVIRSFLYWYAEKNDLSDWSNPIKKVKVKTPSDSPLDPADINAIRAMIKTCQNNYTGIRDKAIILTLP